MRALRLGAATPKTYRNIRSNAPNLTIQEWLQGNGKGQCNFKDYLMVGFQLMAGITVPKRMGWGRNGLISLGKIGV